jgi:hypothetical protein
VGFATSEGTTRGNRSGGGGGGGSLIDSSGGGSTWYVAESYGVVVDGAGIRAWTLQVWVSSSRRLKEEA